MRSHVIIPRNILSYIRPKAIQFAIDQRMTCSSPKYELRWDPERHMSPSCVAACEARSNCKRVLWKKRVFHSGPWWPQCAAHQLNCGSTARPSAHCCILNNKRVGWRHWTYAAICARSAPPTERPDMYSWAGAHHPAGFTSHYEQPISQNEFFHVKSQQAQPTSRPEPVSHWFITATVTRPRLSRGILEK